MREWSCRLRNAGNRTQRLRLEPWGEQHALPPDCTLRLVFRSQQSGEPLLEHDGETLVVWGWPQCRLQAFVDDVELGDASLRPMVPAVPGGMDVLRSIKSVFGEQQ
jgi:hypothetical protein